VQNGELLMREPAQTGLVAQPESSTEVAVNPQQASHLRAPAAAGVRKIWRFYQALPACSCHRRYRAVLALEPELQRPSEHAQQRQYRERPSPSLCAGVGCSGKHNAEMTARMSLYNHSLEQSSRARGDFKTTDAAALRQIADLPDTRAPYS
jgi:hypothetical protein